MFAVVRTGGKQYRVAAGDKIVVEKLAGEAGDTITLGDVLLAGEGSELKSTDGLTVSAEIIAQAKADKVTVFKKRRRHNYRRKKGHRQQHTILRIVAIGDRKAEKPKKAKEAKPETTEAFPTAVNSQVTDAVTADAPAKKPKAPKPEAAPQAAKPKAPKAEAAPEPAAPLKAGPTKKASTKKPAADKKA
jgi:large subunit ribosomal protein L21